MPARMTAGDCRGAAVHVADGSFDHRLLAGSSLAFGVFDGLHTGHRYLIGRAVETRPAGGRAVALTFDIDPDEVFCPQRLRKLMDDDARLEALAASGVDDVVVLPFTPELYTQPPAAFLASAFGAGAPAHLHVGEDFRFGARAAGTTATLRVWAEDVGCELHPHRLVSADGEPVTSTRIRELLLSCELDEANRLLGRPYTLRGTVRRGRGEGTGFGFATANLLVPPQLRVLGEGVYAAYALMGGRRRKAAVSVGVSPTFEDAATANVEAHILDFEGDLVEGRLTLEFAKYLRPMRKFDTTEGLIAAVKRDIEQVRAGSL